MSPAQGEHARHRHGPSFKHHLWCVEPSAVCAWWHRLSRRGRIAQLWNTAPSPVDGMWPTAWRHTHPTRFDRLRSWAARLFSARTAR
ncbi:hypothetical protein SVTN_40450 (plasmid) [Streptomyces vietnamensis]|uniref:Uncharacterized protein n=1 Tax=Streptomyces vietnamensis TaxID=362257 RepID=A0A0B5ID54_9ACTN|nr:hypothetical protein SVTN_40450 [Streptomyces vietnamensis]